MNATLPSTAYDDQTRQRREGADLWGRTKPLLDELDWSRVELARLKAQPAQQAELMRKRKIDAARAKNEALQDAIAKVLKAKRRTLIDKKGRSDRANFVKAQLESMSVSYGLPADYHKTARVNDIRLIRKALREWEKINGLSCKSKQQD